MLHLETMKLFKKVAAIALLSWGFICLAIIVDELSDKDLTPEDQVDGQDTVLGGIAFGFPGLAAGGWLFWGMYQKARKEKSDHLSSTFYRLIQEGNGRIATLRFAMETQLSGKEAKQYLDEKAKEFQADFEVTENGDVNYRFHI